MTRATGQYFGFNTTQARTLALLIDEAVLVDGAVDTAALATGAVTTTKIASAAVTDAKLSLTTPALGTPSAVVLTNATGLPAASVLNTAPTAYAADGAVGPTVKIAMLTKAGIGAYTLAAGADGAHLYIVNRTANAHVVTATGLIDDGVTGGSKNTMTFAAFAGSGIHLVSYGNKWNVIAKNLVTIA